MTAIICLTSMATRHILKEIAERFEAASNVSVAIKAMGGVEVARLIRFGEAADIVVLASGVIDQLQLEGLIVPGSVQKVARSEMAVAVKAGTASPDIRDEAAVRRAVLGAGKIAYSTGPSGDHLLKLCQRWGLPTSSERLVRVPPGVPVGSLVAQGEADLGFQQLSELIEEPGIEIVGNLPVGIQAVTVFAAGVSISTFHGPAARDFIAYLGLPASEDVITAHGMQRWEHEDPAQAGG